MSRIRAHHIKDASFRIRALLTGAGLLLVAAASSTAQASDPKFEYVEPPKKEDEGLKSQVRAGLVASGGNSDSTTATWAPTVPIGRATISSLWRPGFS